VFFPLPVKRLDASIVITSSHFCSLPKEGSSALPHVTVQPLKSSEKVVPSKHSKTS